MIKKILCWIALSLLPVSAMASNSTVTATVTDTDGQIWSYGTVTAKLSLPGGPFGNVQTPTVGGAAVPTTVRGILDANGAFSLSLTDTSSLDQSGGQWTITACPNASITANSSTGCAVVTSPIVGIVNFTSRFTGVVAPRFPAGPDSFGYSDVEISPNPAVPGSRYYNTSTNAALQGLRLWDGKQWSGVGGSSGSSVPGNPYQMQIRDPSAAVLAASNVTVSADRNSVMAPDQMSADRVNGLWNFDTMGTNTQNNLVQAGCAVGTCASNSGIGTTSTDARITPQAPDDSGYTNDAVGVNGTFNPLIHFRTPSYMSWKAQNIGGNNFGSIPPLNFQVTRSHSPFGVSSFSAFGFSENYFIGNEDQAMGSRTNHNGLSLYMNSAGGQIGAVISANAINKGKGDNVGLAQYLQCVGHNEGDDEGCEFHRKFAYDASNRWGINLTAVPQIQASGLYNLTGTAGANYNLYQIGIRNGVIDVTRKYGPGNVQSIQQCTYPVLGFVSACAYPDAGATWGADFGSSTMTKCTVEGQLIQAPSDNETGSNRNTIVCDVSSTAGFTNNSNVVLTGHNFDICQITNITTGKITLSCKEGHANEEILSTGGMAGYAFNFDADIIPNGQFSTKIGTWFQTPNNGIDIRRQVAPIIGFDGTKMYLYTGYWNEFTTMGLAKTQVSSPPALTAQTDGLGHVTGVTLVSQTTGAYESPYTSNQGALQGMLPLPAITFSGGCTAQASFTGYSIDSSLAHYNLNSPITVTGAGSGCEGTVPTAQTLYSNPYGIYPYAQTYSVLVNNGTTYSAPGTTVYATLIDPSKWQSGDLVENELFIHDLIHDGFSWVAKYGTMNSRNFRASSDRNYVGLGGSDSAERFTNQNNGRMFPSRNNPPGNNKGYMPPPSVFEFYGPWRTWFRGQQPYPAGFSNAPAGTVLSTRGAIFEVGCTTSFGIGVDCGSSRDDYDLFKMSGSPAGGNGTDEIYYSPDNRTYYFTNQVRIQAGNSVTGSSPGVANLTVDGTVTVSGSGGISTPAITITNPVNIPAVAPIGTTFGTGTWTLTTPANQYNGWVNCNAANVNFTLPVAPKSGELIIFRNIYASTGLPCHINSSAGIGNNATVTTLDFAQGQTVGVRWDNNDSKWRIDFRSAIAGTTGSIGGSALTAGNCATGTATVTGAVVGSPVALSASDGTSMNPLILPSASVTAADTITVQLCAVSAVTPAAKTYNVRVIN